jgi:hypothetical protein
MVLERVMQTQEDASADDADGRRFLPGPSAQICDICGWFWEKVMQTQDASADDADRRRFLPGPTAQICDICGWFWKGSYKHKKMHPQMTQIAADFCRGHLRKSAPSVDGSGKGHANTRRCIRR